MTSAPDPGLRGRDVVSSAASRGCLAALLLAGCSGGGDTDDTDGDGDADEIEGGGQVDDDDDGEDAPGVGLVATLAVVAGVGAFLMRRKA